MEITLSTLIFIYITICSIMKLGQHFYRNHIYTIEGYIGDKTLEQLKRNYYYGDEDIINFEFNDVAFDYEVK